MDPVSPARRIARLYVACVLLLFPFHVSAQSVALSCSIGTTEGTRASNPLTIAALFADTRTGARYLRGIQDAVQEHALCGKVKLNAHPYPNERRGVEVLTEIVAGGKVDLVLGPTESGVYVRALENRRALEGHEVPVISSLVTANVPHRSGAWFFRTNVGVGRRAETMYDFLNKYWIRSIAVLYAKTEFGRRAEDAFRKELNEEQRDRYLPLGYESPPVFARGDLRQILNLRPEAVGIIGEREDLTELYQALKRMNDGQPYRPILFTIIDARALKTKVDNLYFVSVVDPKRLPEEKSEYDDVSALAYDTTRQVLSQWSQIKPSSDRAKVHRIFRTQFEALMRGPSAITGTLTQLNLAGYKNVTRPHVIHLDNGKLSPQTLDEAVSFRAKLKKKVQLIFGRFGYWPAVNLVLVVAVVTGMTIADIKKWYPHSRASLFKPGNYTFYLLLVFNLGLVASLYLYMGEMGNVRWDSFIAALALAVAPIAVLRANLFETPAGKAIGMGRMYEAALQWINHRLMLAKHRQTQTLINLLAYNNSVDGMRSYLRDIYRHSRTVAQRVRLETELDELVNDRLPYLERRKLCARLLLRTKPWSDLVDDGLAPAGAIEQPHRAGGRWQRLKARLGLGTEPQDEHKSKSPVALRNPETVIREIARDMAGNDDARDWLDEQIEEALKRVGPPARRADLEAARARDLTGIVGEQGRLRRDLAFLCVLKGFNEQALKDLAGGGQGSAATAR